MAERIAVTAAYAIFNQPFHVGLDVAQVNREREIKASYPYGKEKEKSQEIRHRRLIAGVLARCLQRPSLQLHGLLELLRNLLKRIRQ